MKTRKVLILFAIIIFTSTLATASQGHGSAHLRINAGKKGVVEFPHRLHQKTLGNCNACHYLFPKKEGIIKRLKAEGKLGKMKVMNKLCLKCHRKKKKAGQRFGPLRCSQCHAK